MINKIILIVYIVGFSNAVFIDTSEKYHKALEKMNPQTWQMVKVYHPPTQTHGYKYEPYAYPKYEFEYSVSDKKTGDHKHHHEARDGDQVRGEYSLVESDGSLRKVQYHADDHSGFNAIVSKTVSKHGDHAISVSDHTRFFYPMGHNIKINHYFPGKNYHYQEVEKHENNKISIPVHEESAAINNDEGKMVMIEAGNKVMVLEPVKLEEQNNEPGQIEVVPTSKSETVAAIPVQVVPATVSDIPKNTDKKNVTTETVNTEPIEEKDVELPPNELSPANEIEKVEKEKGQDSEVASSFYNTKFYYYSY